MVVLAPGRNADEQDVCLNRFQRGGSLFDGFSGSGTILTYPGRYEFSYDFSNSEKLWGTFDGSVLTFYKSISDSENYRKMTLSKTDNGYVSTCRTDNGTTTLSVTADTIEFK